MQLGVEVGQVWVFILDDVGDEVKQCLWSVCWLGLQQLKSFLKKVVFFLKFKTEKWLNSGYDDNIWQLQNKGRWHIGAGLHKSEISVRHWYPDKKKFF